MSSAGTKGSIPSEVSLLTNLQSIRIKRGTLSGTIPSSLWTLPHLERIDLDHNTLTGGLILPRSSNNNNRNNRNSSNSTVSSFSSSSLKRLDVNFNHLTGSIEFLSSMTNLQIAMLDNNALSGTIPSSIGSLSQLRALTLHGNNLVGTMPDSICQLRKSNGGNLDYLMADCDGVVPKVNCTCCSHCNPY